MENLQIKLNYQIFNDNGCNGANIWHILANYGRIPVSQFFKY